MIREMLEAITVVLLGIEVVAAGVLAILNYREVRFLNKVRPLLPPDMPPLFDALNARARFITLCGAYLLILTALGAIGITPANEFPPLRAINGALLLWLLAGPLVIGRALRRKAAAEARAEARAEDSRREAVGE